jgi:PAS domain S-box-containing protein
MVVNLFRDVTAAVEEQQRMRDELRLSRALQTIALALASELDRDKLVQRITDEATNLVGADFGAFFHNALNDQGEVYMLYTLSGAPREAFERFGQPRATPLFGPTFRGEGTIRLDDVRKDARYGRMGPHRGMPPGHLPVVSYLAVPVASRSGEILGGLFFGHKEPGRFREVDARAIEIVAAHASVALENARLFERARANERRLENEKRDAEGIATALERSERRFRSLVEATSEMVWTTNAKGEVIDDSTSWRRFTGQTYDEWKGHGWLDAVHPDDRARAEQAWHEAVAQKRRYEVPYRVRRADGTWAHTLARGTPVITDGGAIEEWIGLNFDITARVRAQEQALEQQRRLHLALEAGQMGTWEYDVVAGKVAWSPAIERMHGIPVGSFEGTFDAYARDIHPDDRERVLSTVRNTLEGRRDHTLVYRIVRPDGAVRWLEAYGRLFCDDHGNPIRLDGVCRDVTERIEAEQAQTALAVEQAARHEAERSRDVVQRILAGITDSFAVYDREWRVVYANEANTASVGLKPQDVIGRVAWEIVPEAVGTPFHTTLLEVAREGVAKSLVEYYAPLDRWFEMTAYPLGDLGIAAYSRDVTARKREEALRERLVKHGELRAQVGAALAAGRDLRSTLGDCARAVVETLGVSFARIWLVDALGEHLELEASAGKYTHIDGAHGKVKLGALKIGKIAATRTPHLTNDVANDPAVGDKEWASREGMTAFAGYPLVVGDELVGVLATFATTPLPSDTVNALGAIGDAIAQGVVRRRAEIALAERAKELARSNADLEQFAYVASHDLQEPLRMVTSYVQLLARRYRGKLDGDADDFIAYAVEGVGRMQRLINDLLSYSRVGTRGGEFGGVVLEEVFADVESNLRAAIEESGAILTHDPLPEVVGDRLQLGQVLQNLVGNGIKFRREGTPPRIHVGARREPGEWVISVRDNGIGIEPQYFERVFVIFQRLNPREKYPGTGIGLAITKRIVERHGGRIWIESKPGEGSTIAFTIPIDRPKAERKDSGSLPGRSEATRAR